MCIGKNFINLYFADINKETVMIFAGLFLALANGAIGFIDDYTKVVKKRNLGLTAKQKLILQFAAAIILLFLQLQAAALQQQFLLLAELTSDFSTTLFRQL